MDDLISRQAAIDALGVTKSATKYGGDHSGYDTRMLYEIHDVLTGLPSADVVQVKHGKWKKIGVWGRVYRCDQCGNFLDFDGVNAGRGSANFCPNCMAKMDGEE